MKTGSIKYELKDTVIINYDLLLKTADPETAAETILEGSYAESDFMKRDTLDRFLDFVHFKAQTGHFKIISMAYPSRTIADKQLNDAVIEMINDKLYPEIVLRLLKFFTRNIHDSDSNLYLAGVIESKQIIKSIFDTYQLFKKDIFETDPEKRARNVKMIQQFPPRSELNLSSPFDAAARLKYILEFLSVKENTSDIFSKKDLMLSDPDYVPRLLRA